MSVESTLRERAASKCELCGGNNDLMVQAVSPRPDDEAENCILVCTTCSDQIANPENVDVHHWRCLNDSAWSQTPAVQVTAWRMLNRLRGEGWACDLSDMLYLDDELLAWAKASEAGDDESDVRHIDSNGVVLAAGDAVTLIKDLNVKGAGFTAKRGAVVRSISLVADNAKHIEGRVNNQQIVILTEFVKKSR